MNIKKWAQAELGTPNYPEVRVFKAIESYVKTITCCDDEITIYINEKNSLLADG
jgi:hypothetical protein